MIMPTQPGQKAARPAANPAVAGNIYPAMFQIVSIRNEMKRRRLGYLRARYCPVRFLYPDNDIRQALAWPAICMSIRIFEGGR